VTMARPQTAAWAEKIGARRACALVGALVWERPRTLLRTPPGPGETGRDPRRM